jgi:hypothetical protein
MMDLTPNNEVEGATVCDSGCGSGKHAVGVTPADLATWHASTRQAIRAIHLARGLVSRQDSETISEGINRLLTEAQDALWRVGADLSRATRDHPPARSIRVQTARLTLSREVAGDSPAEERILDLLEKLQDAAEVVDRERGTELAETISEIARRVRTEVNGPKGRE